MNKKLLLITPLIAVLSLGGCSKGRQPTEDEAEKEAEVLIDHSKYKMDSVLELKQEALFDDDLTEGITKFQILTSSAVDNEDVLVYEDKTGYITTNEFPLSEVIKNSGNKTVAELKDEYPDYTFDESKGIVSQKSESYEDRYVKTFYEYSATNKQYKGLSYNNGNHLVKSGYTDYSKTQTVESDYKTLSTMKDFLKEVLLHGTKNGNKYTYTPEGGYKIDQITLNEIGFEKNADSLILNAKAKGDLAGAGKETDLDVKFSFTELDKEIFNCPSDDVVCEHKHTFGVITDCGPEGHRQMCMDCHKYLDGEVHEHVYDPSYQHCLECNYHEKYISGQCPDYLKSVDGENLLSLRKHEPSQQYIGDTYSFNDEVEPTVKIYHSFSDCYNSGYVRYYEAEKILIIPYVLSAPSLLSTSSCLSVRTTTFFSKDNVVLTFTPEQQAILDDPTSSDSDKNNVYLAALHIEEKIVDTKAHYEGSNEFNALNFLFAHQMSVNGEAVHISDCLTSTPSYCSKCHALRSVYDEYSHDKKAKLLETPEWGADGVVWIGFEDCSKCHEHDDYLYCVTSSWTQYHYNGQGISANVYDEEGNSITSKYINLPDHLDVDGECALCGAKAITAGGLTVHVKPIGLAENTQPEKGGWVYYDSSYDDPWNILTYKKGEQTIQLKSKTVETQKIYVLVYGGEESSEVVFNLE